MMLRIISFGFSGHENTKPLSYSISMHNQQHYGAEAKPHKEEHTSN